MAHSRNFDAHLDMHEEHANANELLEKTVDSLDDNALKLLFVSVQRNNMDLSMKYAIEEWAHVQV